MVHNQMVEPTLFKLKFEDIWLEGMKFNMNSMNDLYVVSIVQKKKVLYQYCVVANAEDPDSIIGWVLTFLFCRLPFKKKKYLLLFIKNVQWQNVEITQSFVFLVKKDHTK